LSIPVSENSYIVPQGLLMLVLWAFSFFTPVMMDQNFLLRDVVEEIVEWLKGLDYANLVNEPYGVRKQSALQQNPLLMVWFEDRLDGIEKVKYQAGAFAKKEDDTFSSGRIRRRGTPMLPDWLINLAMGTIFALGMTLLSAIPFLQRSF
jgi:hypothetical protein